MTVWGLKQGGERRVLSYSHTQAGFISNKRQSTRLICNLSRTGKTFISSFTDSSTASVWWGCGLIDVSQAPHSDGHTSLFDFCSLCL